MDQAAITPCRALGASRAGAGLSAIGPLKRPGEFAGELSALARAIHG